MSAPLLRIATRGSPLALAQTRLVRRQLAAAHGWAEAELDQLCPILPIKTSGDRIQDRPLAESGGKGLFVKEIEEALLARQADIAVHSLKDMPAALPSGLFIAAVLARENPRDVFVARDGLPFSALKVRAKFGTSSIRRQAQALRARPDLEIVLLRGNVETRLAKLARGEADGIVLAQAGLSRLNLTPPGGELLDTELWLPAPCQGAIGIELREGDKRVCDLVGVVNDEISATCIACERAFLAALDGSCRTPIAGLATIAGGRLYFRGEVLTPDGKNSWAAQHEMALASANDAAIVKIGRDAAREIRALAGDGLPKF